MNANGENIKLTTTRTDRIFEYFYENGVEIKKTIKWDDGRYDELTRIGDGIYEGARTYPDGSKVKLREEGWVNTKLLGPVEE